MIPVEELKIGLFVSSTSSIPGTTAIPCMITAIYDNSFRFMDLGTFLDMSPEGLTGSEDENLVYFDIDEVDYKFEICSKEDVLNYIEQKKKDLTDEVSRLEEEILNARASASSYEELAREFIEEHF